MIIGTAISLLSFGFLIGLGLLWQQHREVKALRREVAIHHEIILNVFGGHDDPPNELEPSVTYEQTNVVSLRRIA